MHSHHYKLLIPNPIYTYILNIYDLFTHLVDSIFQRAWAQFFLIQLNGYDCCSLTLLIPSILSDFFADIEVVTSIASQHLFLSTLFVHLRQVRWLKAPRCNANNST